MLQMGAGQIVTVTSMAAKYGTPLRSTYAATKHALHGFMDSLRAEISSKNIIITLICPGFVSTNVSVNALVGDGTNQGTMDKATQNGIQPDVFAKKMIAAIEADKAEAYIAGFKERLGLLVSKFCPPLFRKLIQKMAVT
jgi:dehydrogenase/reductase SDR family protein 7B